MIIVEDPYKIRPTYTGRQASVINCTIHTLLEDQCPRLLLFSKIVSHSFVIHAECKSDIIICISCLNLTGMRSKYDLSQNQNFFFFLFTFCLFKNRTKYRNFVSIL